LPAASASGGSPVFVEAGLGSDGQRPRARGRLGRILDHFARLVAPEKREISYDWFSRAEVGAYANARDDAADLSVVDGQTYRDLDAPKYARVLLESRSIFARQFFEQRFRFGSSESEATQFADGVAKLAYQDSAAVETAACVEPLRFVQHEVASALFRPAGPWLPSIFARLWFADYVGVLLLFILTFWWTWISVTGIGAYLYASLYVQIKCYRPLKEWTTHRESLLQLLNVASELSAKRSVLPADIVVGSLAAPEPIAHLSKKLTPGWFSRNQATAEYANLLFMYEYARAHREMRVVQKNLGLLRLVFQDVSRVELQLAVAQHVAKGSQFCRPQLGGAGGLRLDDLEHPLIASSMLLSVEATGRSLFISGKNGVGKSTLLRAVGLSIGTFRAFGYAHARAGELPRATVWSSILADDSIEEARSLYMTEMQRAALLLSVSKSGRPVVFLIDELFRGTNYVESVSASTAVLLTLADAGCVLATSHNIVLATLLRDRYEAVRLIAGDGSVAIEPGVISETNGVALMDRFGIDATLISRATAICEWYSGYVAHPDTVPAEIVSAASR
jgi:hypothetical protein